MISTKTQFITCFSQTDKKLKLVNIDAIEVIDIENGKIWGYEMHPDCGFVFGIEPTTLKKLLSVIDVI